jgi:hypothetical protein
MLSAILTHIWPKRFEVPITVETHIIVFCVVTPWSLLEGTKALQVSGLFHTDNTVDGDFYAQRQTTSVPCPDYCRRDFRRTLLINSENENLKQC